MDFYTTYKFITLFKKAPTLRIINFLKNYRKFYIATNQRNILISHESPLNIYPSFLLRSYHP